jgi:8-amino-7-oxononanoate synthase
MLWVFWFKRRRICSNARFARPYLCSYFEMFRCQESSGLGSQELKQYLVNFYRSFIIPQDYPPHALQQSHLRTGIWKMKRKIALRKTLFISIRKRTCWDWNNFVHSKSALQSAIIQVMKSKIDCKQFQEKDLILKRYFAYRSQAGTTSFCLHSYNSPEEISEVLVLLSKFLFNRLVFLYSFQKKYV